MKSKVCFVIKKLQIQIQTRYYENMCLHASNAV